MEGETSTSHEANNAATVLKRWTSDLHGLPSFTYELLTKHFGTEHSGADAQKHKKLGYQLFKDKYVGHVEVKKNVTKGNMTCFLVKGCVNAAMKNNVYTIYVHPNEANGERWAVQTCCCSTIAEPVATIFNTSLTSGTFPAAWKDSCISPIPKVSQPTCEGDTRPISLTHCLSKVLEDFVVQWMTKDVNNLDIQQFGCLKGSSTAYCLLDMIHN
jgi:hypothetical protein